MSMTDAELDAAMKRKTVVVLPNRAEVSTGDPLSWTEEYVMSDEEVAHFKTAEKLIPHLVVRGHIVMWCAKPNGGKTSLLLHHLPDLVASGQRVFYVNADISGSDVEVFQRHAREHDYALMLPDFKPGESMESVRDRIEKMLRSDVDLTDTVWIFDTFKKLTEVISKASNKATLQMLRQMTARGATVILLSHTNKYNQKDGTPIYEGTGDVRSDVDELIYLIPIEDPNGDGIIVTTRPDKVRAAGIYGITYHIHADRTVERVDYVDTLEASVREREAADDATAINVIKGCIRSGFTTKTALKRAAAKQGIGDAVFRRVIETHDGREWTYRKERGNHNRFDYSVIE